MTYGEEEQQLKAHKAEHEAARPAWATTRRTSSRRWTWRRAYGTELYTGVFYRNPRPPPTYDALVRERQNQLARMRLPRAQILDAFVQK